MLLGAMGIVCMTGCGGAPAVNETVEGTLKANGVPLAIVRVNFVPQGDAPTRLPGSTGMTDDKGFFRLAFDDLKPGAVIGKHRVVVLQGRLDPDNPVKRARPNPPIPAEYMNASQTPLQVEVTADKNTYDLNVGP